MSFDKMLNLIDKKQHLVEIFDQMLFDQMSFDQLYFDLLLFLIKKINIQTNLGKLEFDKMLIFMDKNNKRSINKKSNISTKC